jgi:hypothetical protein
MVLCLGLIYMVLVTYVCFSVYVGLGMGLESQECFQMISVIILVSLGMGIVLYYCS